ncbi:hypothetical protein AMAG_15215 [Allomyces macrogynus ATCC 38327]|uniref:Prolyl endopeptidase-like n=1 Tax=Allomyces macrogynus (strain ATCC 38327) TaxID=578462 RepID=A0A0L0T8A8_ALLM3|nr:hypothetical protein AMAG_15215 [Allomyces macrogynus ATCC 38327]|eukprot:KNE70951.1 hypothetical protein AMAG_15215 [Allomyces macrogynus ATCC 38327]
MASTPSPSPGGPSPTSPSTRPLLANIDPASRPASPTRATRSPSVPSSSTSPVSPQLAPSPSPEHFELRKPATLSLRRDKNAPTRVPTKDIDEEAATGAGDKTHAAPRLPLRALIVQSLRNVVAQHPNDPEFMRKYPKARIAIKSLKIVFPVLSLVWVIGIFVEPSRTATTPPCPWVTPPLAWRDPAPPARTVFLPNITTATALSPSLPRDPYAWIADSERAGDVDAYITKEHAYREAATAHLAPLRATLVQELTASDHIDRTIYLNGVPVADEPPSSLWIDSDWHYALFDSGEYVRARTRADVVRRTGTAQVVYNDTTSALEISPNGTFAAVAFDPTGSERQFVRVWSIADQRYLCNGTAFLNIAADTMRWGNDTTLYVAIMDEVTVPRGVVRVDVTACSTHAVFWEPRQELSISAQGQVTAQTHLMLAGTDRVVPLANTDTGAMTEVVADGADLLVRTNRAGADWYEVRRVPGAVARFQSLPTPATALVTDWSTQTTVEVAHQPGTIVERIEVVTGHLLAWSRPRLGFRTLAWRNISSLSNPWHTIPASESWGLRSARPIGYSVGPSTATDLASGRIYRPSDALGATHIMFSNTSLSDAVSQWEVDLVSGTVVPVLTATAANSTALATTQTRIWIDPVTLDVHTVLTNSSTNTWIPVDLAGPTTNAPMLVGAYGAYGDFSDPTYTSAASVLAAHGIGYAYVHPRGDGDFGPDPQGRRVLKAATFADVRASIRALQRHGYATRVAVQVRSAGGLIGATALAWNEVDAVIMHAPFNDMLGVGLDMRVPWTPWEWPEWGDPRNATELASMVANSPYDLVDASTVQLRQTVLVVTARNDARVLYQEPVRLAARARAARAKTPAECLAADMSVADKRPLLLHVYPDGGHWAGTDTDGVAEWMSLVVETLGGH